jgi:D-glycero-beta-D-manno-heptose-7-phosphate kinase
MFKAQEIDKIFKSFEGLKVLIIGDVMIDAYLWGKVDRISPEAPVPVVSLTRRENRPGGAANVALNIQALGAIPYLCSVIGNDNRADEFMELMKENRLPTTGIVRSNNRLTTTKFRVIGNNTHMLRVDEETETPLGEEDYIRLLKTISSLISKKIDLIIFEDYDKGVIATSLIKNVTELASAKKIPVAVDPKKKNFNEYHNITLFKPNLKELREGLKTDVIGIQKEELQRIVSYLMKERKLGTVMVTLSDAGVFICYHDKNNKVVSAIIPAHIRNVADVSGAGDTVISVAALGLATGLTPPQTAALANLAGGLVCEDVGVVPVDKEKLITEARQYLTVA